MGFGKTRSLSLEAFALLQFNNDNGIDLSATVFLSADGSLCQWMNVKRISGSVGS